MLTALNKIRIYGNWLFYLLQKPERNLTPMCQPILPPPPSPPLPPTVPE